MAMLARRYLGLFCTDIRQIDLFPGPIIVDTDDPELSPDLVNRLNDPKVVAVITTTTLLQSRLIELGLKPPCHVIPSGVEFDRLNDESCHMLAARYPRRHGTLRLGYALPKYYLDEELATQAPERRLHSISWLLQVIQDVWKANPDIELWLIGKPSRLARHACRHDSRIRLLGYVPHEEILAHYSLFDIALYPRLVDVEGRHSIKLVEFMACGLPIVSTNVSESFRVRDANAGLVCNSQEAFIGAILRLVGDPSLRAQLGENGRRYARRFDWDRLAQRYDDKVLSPVIARLVSEEHSSHL
jgi:glycosyltransferase involved in cell wall biosynthesis